LKELAMKSQWSALKAGRLSRKSEQWGVAIVFAGLGLVTLVLWVWLSADASLGYVAVAALVAEAFVVAGLDDWRMLRAARRV
jgi:hypothetical protein